MPIARLTSLFMNTGNATPGRVVTSKFKNKAPMDILGEYGLGPVPTELVQLKAHRQRDGSYRVMAHYSAAVQEFTPYSVRLTRAEKTKAKMVDNLSLRDMLRLMARFESAGRGHALHPDNIGTPPRQFDGSKHIGELMKDPKILVLLRPRHYAASRLKKIRKNPRLDA